MGGRPAVVNIHVTTVRGKEIGTAVKKKSFSPLPSRKKKKKKKEEA